MIIPRPDLLEILRLFKRKGVAQVSPGALGMWITHKPFERKEIEEWVRQTLGVGWRGDWLVLTPEP